MKLPYPFFDLVLDEGFDEIDNLVNKGWHVDDVDFFQFNRVCFLKDKKYVKIWIM